MSFLDLTSLEKALAALHRGLQRAQAAPDDEELRDAVIQRFESTMDLCWKMTQRWLKLAGTDEQRFRTKRDLFREAARQGLIDDPLVWFAFYEARNETSHTYDVETARRVFAQAVPFHGHAARLVEKLRLPPQ